MEKNVGHLETPTLPVRVRAFDPTATSEEEAALELHQNVSFHKLGIAHFNGNTQVFVDHRYAVCFSTLPGQVGIF